MKTGIRRVRPPIWVTMLLIAAYAPGLEYAQRWYTLHREFLRTERKHGREKATKKANRHAVSFIWIALWRLRFLLPFIR